MNLIDVSNAQGNVDWGKVRRAGIQGAWLKATEGSDYNDAYFEANRRRARAAGVRVGAYHFARPEHNTAKTEADHFCHAIGKPGRRDLKPVLDMEGFGSESWAHQFSKRVRDNIGVTPIFYTYSAWLEEHKFEAPVGNGLWIANYDGILHPPLTPKPWKKYVAHQYTDKGAVAGVSGHVDRSWGTRGVLAHPVKGLL